MDARVALVARFYEAFCGREWDEMRGLFADDAELGVSGRNPFAGEHRGPDAIVGVFRDIVDRSEGTLSPVRPDTWDICSSEHHVILLEWFRANVGGRHVRAFLYFVCAVEHDKIARMFVHSSEQYEFDEFWS